MSAPSDGARADARKRLAESIGRLEGRGNWYTDDALAGVIADAKAEASLQIMDAIEKAANLARVGSGDMTCAADHYADGLLDAVIIARRVTS